MKIIEREVGEGAAAYFLNELMTGGALSKFLRTCLLSSSGGRWSVLLPEIASGDIHQFRIGGKFPSGESRDIRGGRAVELLNAGECLATIFAGLPGATTFAFEAVHLRRSDIVMPRLSGERLAVLDETVLVLTDSGRADAGELFRCLRVANSGWYEIAVASEANRGGWLQARQDWTIEDAVALADGAQCVALRIYDGESFMLWRRE